MNIELIRECLVHAGNSSVFMDRLSKTLAWMTTDKTIGEQISSIKFNVTQAKARLEEDIKLLHKLLEKEKQ